MHSLGTQLPLSVITAGLFGGITIKWSIQFFQSLPALIAPVSLAFDSTVKPPESQGFASI